MRIVLICIGLVIPTAYRSVRSQTDSSPYRTSTGERCNVHGIAVSRDYLKRWGGPLDYGDLVYLDGIGFRFVNDCMAPRYKRRVDVWVEVWDDEHKFFKKWKAKQTKMYIVRTIPDATR